MITSLLFHPQWYSALPQRKHLSEETWSSSLLAFYERKDSAIGSNIYCVDTCLLELVIEIFYLKFQNSWYAYDQSFSVVAGSIKAEV